MIVGAFALPYQRTRTGYRCKVMAFFYDSKTDLVVSAGPSGLNISKPMLAFTVRSRSFSRFEKLLDLIHPGLGAGIVAARVLATDGFEFLEKLFLT